MPSPLRTSARPTAPPTPVLHHLRTAYAAQRLIELARKDGWGRLYHAGKVADSKQQHGQEAA